jgi:hypothetical protein
VKVGDFVKCTTLHGLCESGKFGIIVQSIPGFVKGQQRHFVLLNGRSNSWPFLEKQLELVSESR